MVTNRDRKSFGSRLTKKFEMLLRRLVPLTFMIRVQAFQDQPLPESFRMSKSSRMMERTRSREMPSCWAIDLTEIRRSSKISSWIWSIVSGVVTVLGPPRRGASQVEKSPYLHWATQFLVVAYDGACFRNVSVRMAWISLSTLPCRGKKIEDSSRLDVVEIACVAWHASFQPLQQEKACNSAHEHTPLSNDTIDSVLRHREVGRAKDFSAPPRTLISSGVAWSIPVYLCLLSSWEAISTS